MSHSTNDIFEGVAGKGAFDMFQADKALMASEALNGMANENPQVRG